MELKNSIYNLNTMKKTILFLFSIVIFSGCATSPIKRVYFGDIEPSKFKGGSIYLEEMIAYKDIDNIILSDGLKKEIFNVCSNEKFRLTSIEKNTIPNGGILFFLVFFIQEFKAEYILNFECIYEKK